MIIDLDGFTFARVLFVYEIWYASVEEKKWKRKSLSNQIS